MMSSLVLATTNPGKVREVAAVLAPLCISVRSLAEVGGDVPEPEEDASTFEGNARLKAVAYAKALGLPCLAEDSGLEVDALGGAPGVYSARYSGSDGSRDERDARNNQKLLHAMADVPEAARAARFVCALCLVDAQGGVLFETRGEYGGVIVREPRGTGGFGYDPLLLVPELGRTSAELSPAEKNARSHRGQAVRALAAYLAGNS
jgi:non-canonical purine NTP pyrophosphatase (RdgB/HAM1 family)